MINVLLVKIIPTDQELSEFEYFPEKPFEMHIKVSVFNGCQLLNFRADKKYYASSGFLNKKIETINKELNVDYGGHAVAIDKYSLNQFQAGAKLTDSHTFTHYDFEADFENSDCDCLVLSVPGLTPIPLSRLRFGCDGFGVKGYCPDSIIFNKEAILSITLPFGDVKGITLNHCSEYALNPDADSLQYKMQFERISLPAVVLQKLLQ